MGRIPEGSLQSIPSKHMPPSVNKLQGPAQHRKAPLLLAVLFSEEQCSRQEWMGNITLRSLKSLIVLCELSQFLPLEYFFNAPPPKKKNKRYRLVLNIWPGAQGSQGVFFQGLTGSALVLLPSAAPLWATFDSPSPGGNSPFLGHTHSFSLAPTPSPFPFTDAYCSWDPTGNSRYLPHHLSKPK